MLITFILIIIINVKQKEQLANQMRHSVLIAQTNYLKIFNTHTKTIKMRLLLIYKLKYIISKIVTHK